MAYPTFCVIGQVIDRRTKQGVRGLRVEAWDKDQKYHDFLGVGITDRGGHFLISFDQTYFREYPPEKFPDLFFRIYLSKRLLKSTEDSVIWDAKEATVVTIDIDMPAPAPIGKDWVSARQVFKAVDFVQRSDFLGLWRETKDKVSASCDFLCDMVTNTIRKMDVKPIRPGELKTRDVIGQDVAVAERNLSYQQVTVNEVKPYQPGLNKESITVFAALPITLKSGQEVNLYEEKGKVRYYSIVKEPEPAEINATDVIRLDNEMTTVTSRLNVLDKAQSDLVSLKTTSEKNKGEITKVIDAVKAQLAVVDGLKKELETIRKQSTQKDDQILALQEEVKSLLSSHNKLEKKAAPEAIARIEKELKKLQEFKATVAQPSRPTRKSSTTRKKMTNARTSTKKKT